MPATEATDDDDRTRHGFGGRASPGGSPDRRRRRPLPRAEPAGRLGDGVRGGWRLRVGPRRGLGRRVRGVRPRPQRDGRRDHRDLREEDRPRPRDRPGEPAALRAVRRVGGRRRRRPEARASDARLRWDAAPNAAGYRVVWREAWAPSWRCGARRSRSFTSTRETCRCTTSRRDSRRRVWRARACRACPRPTCRQAR